VRGEGQRAFSGAFRAVRPRRNCTYGRRRSCFGLLYLERRPAGGANGCCPFVSPFLRRVLFTVRGDAGSRRERCGRGPRRRLIFRTPLALLAPGLRIRISFRAGRTHFPQSARSYAFDCSGERGRSRRSNGSSSTTAATRRAARRCRTDRTRSPRARTRRRCRREHHAENIACPSRARRAGTVRCIVSTAQPRRRRRSMHAILKSIRSVRRRAYAIRAQTHRGPGEHHGESFRSENRRCRAGNARSAEYLGERAHRHARACGREESPASRTNTPNIR